MGRGWKIVVDMVHFICFYREFVLFPSARDIFYFPTLKDIGPRNKILISGAPKSKKPLFHTCAYILGFWRSIWVRNKCRVK